MKGQRNRKRQTYLARSQRRAAKQRKTRQAEAHRHHVRMQLRAEGRKWQRQHPAHPAIAQLVQPEPQSSASAIDIRDWLEKRKAG
jgi:hypothetical protein